VRGGGVAFFFFFFNSFPLFSLVSGPAVSSGSSPLFPLERGREELLSKGTSLKVQMFFFLFLLYILLIISFCFRCRKRLPFSLMNTFREFTCPSFHILSLTCLSFSLAVTPDAFILDKISLGKASPKEDSGLHFYESPIFFLVLISLRSEDSYAHLFSASRNPFSRWYSLPVQGFPSGLKAPLLSPPLCLFPPSKRNCGPFSFSVPSVFSFPNS